MGIEGYLPQKEVKLSSDLKYKATLSYAGNKVGDDDQKFKSTVNRLWSKMDGAKISFSNKNGDSKITADELTIKNATLTKTEKEAIASYITTTLSTAEGRQELASNNKNYQKQLDKIDKPLAEKQAEATAAAKQLAAMEKNEANNMRVIENKIRDTFTSLRADFPESFKNLQFISKDSPQLLGNSWMQDNTTVYVTKDTFNDLMNAHKGLSQLHKEFSKAEDAELSELVKQSEKQTTETVKLAYTTKYKALDIAEKDRFDTKYGSIDNFLAKLEVKMSYDNIPTTVQEKGDRIEISISKNKAEYCNSVLNSDSYGAEMKQNQLTAFKF